MVTVACTPADLGSGIGDVSALADVTGLTPSTTYDFRAVATNSLTASNGFDGPPTQFATAPPASIDSDSATNITDTGATLNAQINPEGTDTTCTFQYVDDTDFQSTGFTGPNAANIPCTPADLGAGTSDVSAVADLTGLTPNTVYDFRAVVTNSLTGAEGLPDQTTRKFKTFASGLATGLPDGRAYEMVTPASKDSGEVFSHPSLFQPPFGIEPASTDGNRMGYFSFNAFPGSQFDGSFYVAARGSTNWVSRT